MECLRANTRDGNTKPTDLRQRLPIIILAKAKQYVFGAMHYALLHSDALANSGIGALRPGRGASTSMLRSVHHCFAGSQV
jgi:hypothetical protein